jgi:hypothetical protein
MKIFQLKPLNAAEETWSGKWFPSNPYEKNETQSQQNSQDASSLWTGKW